MDLQILPPLWRPFCEVCKSLFPLEFGLSDILPFIPTEAKAGAAAMGIIPAGLIFWSRRRKQKQSKNNEDS